MNKNAPVLSGLLALTVAGCAPESAPTSDATPSEPFAIEEATIAGMQAAIHDGRTTCVEVVEAYIERAKAYNGVCTALVTAAAADIAPAFGYTRAGKPLEFPTHTVAASTVFPELAGYKGLPLEYGRMETTVSDPTVVAQIGMRVGMPDAGQVNALETLNVRGERSVTCKGAFDAHPSTGPLPAGAPEVCEEFRKQPDALERAAELDKQYGRNPDLAALPMYCVVTSVKDPFDTKDMRTTSNNDGISRWMCRRSTRRSSRSSAPRARSSTRSRARTSSTAAPAIPAALRNPFATCPTAVRCKARGADSRAIRMTPSESCAARAAAAAPRSAPTSRWSASASNRAPRARDPRRVTASH
jgi:hypothetical protein